MYREVKHLEDIDWFTNSNLGEICINNSKLNNIFDYMKRTTKFNFNILLNAINYKATYIVAKYIHVNSNRNTKSFIKFNCNKTPKNLIDIELFGCEPGTYRDFPEGKKGILEIYNGGTVYLEEVSHLPLYVQYKLIDLIEEGIIDKSGSTEKIMADVKLIASTKKDLKKLIKEGLFIKGLYYSLIEMEIFY